MSGSIIVSVIGYGVACSFVLGASIGFLGAISTKPGSLSEQQAVVWWIGCSALALTFAAVTHALVGRSA